VTNQENTRIKSYDEHSVMTVGVPFVKPDRLPHAAERSQFHKIREKNCGQKAVSRVLTCTPQPCMCPCSIFTLNWHFTPISTSCPFSRGWDGSLVRGN